MDLTDTEELYHGLGEFSQKRFGFKNPPSLHLVSDSENSAMPLGKTAYYDPQGMAITIYTDNRHTKDILRSLAHELVHHMQNENGMLNDSGYHGEGYAQKNKNLRSMESEAYEKGNLCMRDWEDQLKQDKPTIYNEWRNNTMSLKQWKNNELMENLSEKFGFKMDLSQLNEGEVPAGLKKYQDEQAGNDSEGDSKESTESGEKPDFPDVDGDGDKEEPISKAQQDKKNISEGQDGEVSQLVNKSYQVFLSTYGEQVESETEGLIIQLLSLYEESTRDLNEGLATIKANLTPAELASFDHALDMLAEKTESMKFQRLLGFLGQTSTQPIPKPFPGTTAVISNREQSKAAFAFVKALKRISRISRIPSV